MTKDNTGRSVESEAIFRKLAGAFGVGGSERIVRLLGMLCSDAEAQVMAALPATKDAVVEKTGFDAREVDDALKGLFIKGLVFERIKEGVSTFSPPKNLVQFHDATVLWPGAPAEFIDTWKEFMDEEYPQFLQMITSAGLGPFMRIIPINKAIEGGSEVLPYEHAARMIGDAEKHAVTDCTCRLTQKNCDRPVNICIQLDRGAAYAIKRGTGREIAKDEALALLDKAEEAGLVHLSENRSRAGNVICNCCSCCCMALEPMKSAGIKGFAAPSRYVSAVDADRCAGCLTCVERCPMDAVSDSGGQAEIDEDKCIGCGLCMSTCPEEAISLLETRPPDFIP